MKKRNSIILHFKRLPVFLIPALLNFAPFSAYTQEFSLNRQWYVGIQSGMTSFFGDLSIHDFNPVRKITDESDIALGLVAGKSINRFADISLLYTHGRMHGSNPAQDLRFKNRFNEYVIESAFNINQLINSSNDSRINFYGTAGLGFIRFRSIKYRISDGAYIASVGYNPDMVSAGSAKNTFIVPVGVLMQYRYKMYWMVYSSFSMRIHNKDLLDSQKGSTGINDRYTIFNLGIAYLLAQGKLSGSKKLECPSF